MQAGTDERRLCGIKKTAAVISKSIDFALYRLPLPANICTMNDKCYACNMRCGVSRSVRTGFCGIDDGLYIAHFGLHMGEEPFLTGDRGSGTVFFAGCTLRCRFCQNSQISRYKSGDESLPVKRIGQGELADIFYGLLDMGAANINLVSPTPYVSHIAEAIEHVKRKGFPIPFVYNTHGADSPETVDALAGLVDIWLPDMKYGSDELGLKYSGAAGLYSAGKETVRRIYGQAGPLELNEEGLAVRGTAVRHLILPGEVENSLAVVDFLETVDRRMQLSLMSQFRPSEGGDSLYPQLSGRLTQEEYGRVTDYALALGFSNIWLQDMESPDIYVPDFGSETVFSQGGAA